MTLPYGLEKLEIVGVRQVISMIHGLGNSSELFPFKNVKNAFTH